MQHAPFNQIPKMSYSNVGNNLTNKYSLIDLNVAIMYNVYDTKFLTDPTMNILTSSSNMLTLDPYGTFENNDYVMPLKDFIALFYGTGSFNVNQAARGHSALLFSGQTITNVNGQRNKFSLSDALQSVYCINNGISINSLDPRIRMLLNREVYSILSLTNIKGTCLFISWEEIMYNLKTFYGLTETVGKKAIIQLSIIVNIHSFVLNTDLMVRIPYIVEFVDFSLPDNVT
jgi:hypothetical protein